MKKILLILLLSCPLFAVSQIKLSTTFDFNNPMELDPQIIPGESINSQINVFNKTFKSGPIMISFSLVNPQGGGGSVAILTEDENSYCLRLTQGIVMTIKCENRVTLNSIHISNNSTLGDFGVRPGQPGSQASNNWSANDGESVTSLQYWNTGELSLLKQITVDYTAPSDVLVPTTDLTAHRTTPFTQMVLTFDRDVSRIDVSGIRLTGSNNTNVSMNSQEEGNIVTLSVPNPIALDGTYSITIPSKSYGSSDGYQNSALSYTFTIEIYKATFDYIDVSPKNDSSDEKLCFPIVLTFPNEDDNKIGKVDKSKIFNLFRDNSPLATVKADWIAGTNEVKLRVLGSNGQLEESTEYTRAGVYTLTVDEGTVFNQMYASTLYVRYNPEINLRYTVVDPLKELKDEAMRLKKLLGSQVGYPTLDSDAGTLLINETKEDATPTKESLENAINAFYTETNVVMPEEGEWYTIASVNDNNNKIYLTYQNGEVALGNESDAGKFKVNSFNKEKKTAVFETKDGKFLHVLTGSSEYDLTSPKNVTDKKEYCNLGLAKMDMESITDKTKLLGVLSIYGFLGRKDANAEKPDSAYAKVSHEQVKIVTDASDKEYAFDADLTTGFVFLKTSKPEELIPIDPQVKLSVTEIASNKEVMRLYFTNVDKVAISDASKIYFATDAAGENRVNPTETVNILTEVIGTTNEFDVHANGLNKGDYYLIMKSGAFNFDESSRLINQKDLYVRFKIENPNFNDTYTSIAWNLLNVLKTPSDYVADVDLNDLIIFDYIEDNPGLVADPTKEVWLVDGLLGGHIKKGHFVPYPTFAQDFPFFSNRVAIRLVLDEPYLGGELQYAAGLYAFDIPAATFGDANFGRYLQGDPSVDPSQCKVNPRITNCSFQLDNSLAITTGVKNVFIDSNIPVIFDLQGRRVQNMDKKGVYIVNGQKVVIK